MNRMVIALLSMLFFAGGAGALLHSMGIIGIPGGCF